MGEVAFEERVGLDLGDIDAFQWIGMENSFEKVVQVLVSL